MGDPDYDVVIVGGAPAGLTAAIYAARRKMKTVVISINLGGQILETNNIENYPGYMSISGANLTQKFYRQAVKAGAEVVNEEVVNILEGEGHFVVKTKDNEYRCRAVILAFGKTPRKMEVPGEKELSGRGVSYCVTCDAPLFKNKTIAVVGGGNSAVDAASYGSKIASKVYLIHRRAEFRAFESVVDEARKRPNVEFVLNSVIKEVRGGNSVMSIIVEDVNTKEAKELTVDGVFVEIGSEVNPNFVKHLVKVDESNQVIVDGNTETFYPNSDTVRPDIFGAGDATNVPFKQIVVAAGEGCKAALQAYNYLHGLKPKASMEWAAKH